MLKVFVYGSLKQGYYNDRPFYVERRVNVEKAIVVGTLYDLGHYPGLDLNGRGLTRGEIHTYPDEVAEEVVERLDSLEGYVKGRERNHYTRVLVDAELENGEIVKASAYEISKNDPRKTKVLKNGVWPAEEKSHMYAGR
jgi:gamma-glutamylcyclotransferase (GGCT)/AIG2-like uncharacterized protein YtfP